MKSIASITSVEVLGATVRRARNRRNFTQLELAGIAGVSRSFIIELEDGHPRAELGKVLTVLNALDISLAALVPDLELRSTPRVNPSSRVTGRIPTSDPLQEVDVTQSRHSIQYNIARQHLDRERRARTMADITRGWSEGRNLPDQEAQQIVHSYIEGVLTLDEAIAKAEKLPRSRG